MSDDFFFLMTRFVCRGNGRISSTAIGWQKKTNANRRDVKAVAWSIFVVFFLKKKKTGATFTERVVSLLGRHRFDRKEKNQPANRKEISRRSAVLIVSFFLVVFFCPQSWFYCELVVIECHHIGPSLMGSFSFWSTIFLLIKKNGSQQSLLFWCLYLDVLFDVVDWVFFSKWRSTDWSYWLLLSPNRPTNQSTNRTSPPPKKK